MRSIMCVAAPPSEFAAETKSWVTRYVAAVLGEPHAEPRGARRRFHLPSTPLHIRTDSDSEAVQTDRGPYPAFPACFAASEQDRSARKRDGLRAAWTLPPLLAH